MVLCDLTQEGPNEPQHCCPRCARIRSYRWFRQSTVDLVTIEDPSTGEPVRYGQPIGVCGNCYKGQLRGPKAAQIGRLYKPDEPVQPQVPTWVREQAYRTYFGLD